MEAQFEHLCRICAANTKSKNNSIVESVFIFKTTGLKDKIAKHIFLNVSEDDPLPKVLCKSCYRQVEATASLSNIAKHTQRVFKDFLINIAQPKPSRESTIDRRNVSPSFAAVKDLNVNQWNQSFNQQRYSSDIDTFHPIMLTRPPEVINEMSSNQPVSNTNPNDVVNTLNNKGSEVATSHKSQTRTMDNQSIKYRDNTKPTISSRRNSHFGDSRYSSTPMSIAQRSMQQSHSLTQANPDMDSSRVTKNVPEKKNSPAGVINFIQTHGRITGTRPTVITPSGCNPQAINNAGVPNLPTNVLQQKRRNLKNTLNNISAIRDGQISLLKSSHQRSTANDNNINPLVTTTVVPHLSLYGAEPSVEEALPEHIIIAAPKKKRDESLTLIQHVTAKVESNEPNFAKNCSNQTTSDFNLKSKASANVTTNINNLTDSISLGNVIRDPDLLMLILKALKWPVTMENCEEQMSRLKNSKFAVIMSDRNLLQNTDLTQLLGPYLGPMMNIIQQQKQAGASNEATVTHTQASAEAAVLGDCKLYKLPPETSVQLVPSSPTDSEQPQSYGKSAVPPTKRPRRKSRSRDNMINMHGSNSVTACTSNAELVTNELLNINSILMSQFGSSPADALNEALKSLLKQQETNSNQRPRRSRSVSATKTPINLEDIILVEPQPSLNEITASSSEINSLKLQSNNTCEHEIITRPVIKRRKGATQIGEKNCIHKTNVEKTLSNNIGGIAINENIQIKDADACNVDVGTSVVPGSLNSQHGGELLQAPTSTVIEVVTHKSLSCDEDHSQEVDVSTQKNRASIKETAPNVRKADVKSALGQKLLEAIGLPQPGKNVPSESSRDTLRSALKRSLKQAQEQQQQLKRVKLEEPVKQIADSTTKSVAGESSEEHKKAIAERELELLKQKASNVEKKNLSIKDEKTERMDVSSSSSRNRRSRNKFKSDPHEEDILTDERKCERWDEDDELPLKAELEKSVDHANRPARTSKTMSKYYKNPGGDKSSLVQKSHTMGTRSARQR